MPQGNYAWEYLHEPNINKTQEEIFQDLGSYTAEIFEWDTSEAIKTITAYIICPPLYYDGHFQRGILISQGIDYLMERYPLLQELFVPVAVSMSYSYPKSTHAEGYLTMYRNAARDAWFREAYLERADVALIPQEDADYINEYVMRPIYDNHQSKDIDILTVSSLQHVKNLPMLAKGVKAYHQKYNKKVKMTILNRYDVVKDYNNIDDFGKEVLKLIDEACDGETGEYIEYGRPVYNHAQMANYYSRAKMVALGSLLEGKNRSIHEAQACDTPVIYNRLYNQYTRGEDEIMSTASGMTFEYDPESIADTIHYMLGHYGDYAPRRACLRRHGRRNFFNTCIDYLPYYQDMPGYQAGAHWDNEWLNLAMIDNYGVSLYDFTYKNAAGLSTVTSPPEILKKLNQYAEHMQRRVKNAIL